MKKQTQPLNTALRTLLWRRLFLPFLTATLVVMGLAAYYGGRLVEAQQLRYSQSIGYTATHFLIHAGHELDALNMIVSSGSLDFIRISMTANQSSHGVFETVYLLDKNKKIKIIAPFDSRYQGLDMSHRGYFNNLDCTSGVNFSIPFTSLRTGQPTAYLTRCTDTGEYLVGELNLHALQETIAETQQSPQGMVFIVDQTGTLLAHPDSQLVAQHINLGDLPIVKNGLIQDTTTHYWYADRFWVGSASKIAPTDWIVVTEVPMLVIYAPYIGAIFGLALLFTLIFSLAVRVFLIQLQRKLVTPLIYLSTSVDALAGGNYTATEVRLDDTIPFTEISGLLTNFRNMRRAISARETQLKESENQYRRLIEYSPDAILLHSNSTIIYANASAINLYTAKTVDDFIGKPMINLIHSDSQPMVQARLQKLEEKEQALPLVEQKHIKFDQSVFHAEVITSSIFFAGSYVAQTIVRDITKRKNEEQILKYRATHDYLTDLPNRFLFQDRLQHALVKAKRNKTFGAVLYLDLDGFKSINDVFGHNVGDQVLQNVAVSLKGALRENDTVARLGGDEFVVLLDDLNNPLDAERVANNIYQTFLKTYMIEAKDITISFSIGISVFPEDGLDTQSLLQSADAAMYEAKQEGKHRAKFYAPYMREKSLERILLQTHLNHALDQNQLFLQYQPQVNYQTGQIIGVEALLRWNHPELGLVSPSKFIPIAEETGLILPIGEWILQTACAQAHQWQRANFHSMHVGINLSNLQFKQSNIVDTIQKIIRDTRVSPEFLEIELTENIVFHDADTSFSNVYNLKSIGVALAMDDFGAGFSTLGYLAHIPFDRIKIDQNLVANIEDPKDAAVVSGIITICKNLNLEVIAEGVETPHQLTFCASKGCNFFQGWYYSPAVDSSIITQYLLEGVPWRSNVN